MKDNKIKIKMGYEKLTPDDVNKGKDFSKLYKTYTTMKYHWFKNPKKFGGIASAVVVTVTAITITVIKYKHSAPVPVKPVVQTQTVAKTNTVTTPAKTKPFINPPIKKADIAYKSYKVNADKGARLNYGDKTVINIPKNCFVDKNGKDVSGKVTIKYREFHTPVDFFLSGIPMTYDSAGKQYTFESAGMFDIRGFKDGQPVWIKKGKNINVHMASVGKGTNYNTYVLDTVRRKWVFIEKSKMLPAASQQAKTGMVDTSEATTGRAAQVQNKIASIKKEEDKLKNTVPVKPEKSDPGRYSFNINADAKDFPELAVYKNMLFEVDAKETSFEPKYMQETWTSADLKRKNSSTYTFTVKRGEETHSFIVHPVFDSKDYAAAMKAYDKKYAEYQQAIADKMAEEKKEEAAYQAMLKKKQEEAKIQEEKYEKQLIAENKAGALENYFAVNQFGIWNSDCPGMLPKGAELAANYTDNLKDDLNTMDIYLVEKDKNALYIYHPGHNCQFNPDKQNFAWCVTPDSKVAIFSEEDFKKIQQRRGDYTFVMQVVNKDIKSEDDIRDLFKTML